MQFSPQHLDSFRTLSGDRNPLHQDERYASRTQFGQVVVFGMASVLYGLGAWAKGRRFELQSIRGEFTKPLFVSDELELQFEASGNKVTTHWLKNGVSQSRFVFAFSDSTEGHPVANRCKMKQAYEEFLASPAFFAESRDCAASSHSSGPMHYALDPAATESFEELFHLRLSQLPLTQLNCLLWSSYQVGMVYPGQQALYASFDIRFRPGSDELFLIDGIEGSATAGLGIVSLKARAPSLEKLAIRCFRRPPPVDFPIGRIHEAVGGSGKLAGKTALVSGASRGFGSALAKTLALQGSRVLINFWSNEPDAVRVRDEIVSAGGSAELFQGDLSDPAGCVALADRVSVPLDILVNNASPLIGARQFSEQGAAEFMAFVLRSLGLYCYPLQTLLPTMPAGATIVSISSVYVAEAPGLFSHYVAAKSAIEGMLAVVAKEHPDKRFVTIRLPKILTDQTNVSFTTSPALDASQLLGRVLEAICDPSVSGIVDLGRTGPAPNDPRSAS